MARQLTYPERRWLRVLEGMWARVEGYLNHLTRTAGPRLRPYNPLYHLGTLSIFLLIVLAVTGTYLTLFYRPGADRAYESVAGISATWLGSIMRSVHVYASDGLAMLLLLHAIKMFIGDRFWGSRWLAWVSGWVSLLSVWIIGVMGYWLVWDQRAQWLTEYGMALLKGSFALSFVMPNIASETFALFVIILFLHIFLTILIVVSLIIHVVRLTRVRVWSPRWLMIGASVVLVILALWRPATSAPPADMSRLVGTVFLDGWYLGFLPFVVQWGSPSIWGLTLVVLAFLMALPWLLRGKTAGPATVAESMCTGCALCFQQCPYSAIEMRPHTASDRYATEAVIYPALCTGCGLCVGTCSTAGAQLSGLPSDTIRQGLQQSLAAARAEGSEPIVVYTCQRHATLGTLPDLVDLPMAVVEREPAMEIIPLVPTGSLRQQAAPIEVGAWSPSNPHPRSLPVVTCALPCVGMLQPEWVKESLDQGAQAALVLSCPSDDCAFREGPHWLAAHLGRRRSLLRRGVYWLESAPADRSPLAKMLATIDDGEALTADHLLRPADKDETTPLLTTILSVARPLAVGMVLLALAFIVASLIQWPGTAAPQDEGLVRVAIEHAGQFKAASSNISAEVEAKLPDNISPEQVLGGERYPVGLRVELDGDPVIERVYEPRGLRREGEIYALESWSLEPGTHQLRLWVMDDGENWQPVFDGPVEVEAGRVRTLNFDGEQERFELR